MGATKYTAAAFPIGSKQAEDSNVTGQSALLGSVVTGAKGEVYRLVRLNKAAGLTAALSAKTVFKWSAIATHDVDVATLATDVIAGVGVTGQEALDDNDLFWLIVDGPCVCMDSGSGVTAGQMLSPTTAGEVLTGSVFTDATQMFLGSDVLVATQTAAADADVYAQFIVPAHAPAS